MTLVQFCRSEPGQTSTLIYINPDHVLCVEPSEDRHFTLLYLPSGFTIRLEHSLEFVLKSLTGEIQ